MREIGEEHFLIRRLCLEKVEGELCYVAYGDMLRGFGDCEDHYRIISSYLDIPLRGSVYETKFFGTKRVTPEKPDDSGSYAIHYDAPIWYKDEELGKTLLQWRNDIKLLDTKERHCSSECKIKSEFGCDSCPVFNKVKNIDIAAMSCDVNMLVKLGEPVTIESQRIAEGEAWFSGKDSGDRRYKYTDTVYKCHGLLKPMVCYVKCTSEFKEEEFYGEPVPKGYNWCEEMKKRGYEVCMFRK